MTAMRPQEGFWNWFVQHEAELFEFDLHLEPDRERLFDQVAAELQKVDPDLAFEFGPSDIKREFVISAGGIRRAFPAVVALAKAAPSLPRWSIIAFRPRRSPINPIDFQGKDIHPEDVQFTLLDNGETAGVYLFIPGIREKDVALKSVGYLLLDEALGEYDVETRLGLIKMLPPETATEGDRYPLSELANFFDQLVARLEGRSGEGS